MPDLGNLLTSSSLALTRYQNFKIVVSNQSDAIPIKELDTDHDWCSDWDPKLRFPIDHKKDVCSDGNGIRVSKRWREKKSASDRKTLDGHLKAWVSKNIELGVPETRCLLPCLTNAPRQVGCTVCENLIYPGEEVICSVRGCQGVYHSTCAKERLGFSSSKQFKCPQHACFLCKQKNFHLWRCVRCHIASHDKCAPFPEHVIRFPNQPGRAVCWRHLSDWRLEKRAVPLSNIEEIFCQLPLPYVEEEFKIDTTWKGVIGNKIHPPPYTHIKRNIYLVKKRRDDIDVDIGCTNCSSTQCSEDCVCRVQCISCSKACRCSEMCTNRPFRRERKIKIVKTELCGWGVEAAESINKGDFIIEYIGEVIDDALCEQRLWDMKYSGVENFYMCEIRKDFTIDASFKGNSSRFLNHSCDPNCVLEKWDVDGDTRVGVFAARSIKAGEPLTYDYRFVVFGPQVKCHCGAPNCQGYLGIKRKIGKLVEVCWGSKRPRTPSACFAIVKV